MGNVYKIDYKYEHGKRRRLAVHGRDVSPVEVPPVSTPPQELPTYADRDVTINPGDNWQTVINGQAAGTSTNPIIFGVTQGTHVRADALGAKPKNYHWFVGESDGVPTAQFPNGSPISLVAGTRSTGPGTDTFLENATASLVTGVKVIMLEVDGFSPVSNRYVMGGVGTVNWQFSHVNLHHTSEGGIRCGMGMQVAYCWIHHNGRRGMTANVQAGTGLRLENVVVESTTVEYNNQFEYVPNQSGSGAGGSKFIGTNGMTIQRCDFSRNGGPGIWFDSGSTGMQILDNTAWDNVLGSQGGEGIFIEICDVNTGALIDGNDVRRNSAAANIYFSSSRGSAANPIVCSNNHTENHPQWEVMILNNGNRGPGDTEYIEITDNTFIRTQDSTRQNKRLAGVRVVNGGSPAATLNGIEYDRNNYTWNPAINNAPFQVDTANFSFASWQGLGYDPNSAYGEV